MDESILKICFDTGHHSYAGFDPVAFMRRHIGRISYMHFKDIDPVVKADAIANRTGFYDACGQGIFCNLGKGDVDFPAVRQILLDAGFEGWCTVEQDCDPTLDVSPIDDARQNREYLSSIGFTEGPHHGKTELGHDRRRRRQPDRPGPPAWARWPTGISTWSPGRWTTGPTRGATMRSGWAWPPTAPMATGSEMLAGERNRPDRVDLVTVATPNSTHFEITKAFLEAGFNVLCEKPMTMTVEEGEEIVRIAAKTGKICAVNYCYSAYPMVRQARAMVRGGDIGKVRLVVTNFSHGHHGDATDADNPRVRWRYDPAMAGVSGQFADCGIHALHMASFICDDEVETLSADFASTIPSRGCWRMTRWSTSACRSGTVGRLWTSSVAIGRQHGFDIQVFGETGGFRWASEQPNQLIYTPVGGRTQIMEKGEGGLVRRRQAPVSRVAIAHPEGFPLAVANIYCDLADAIRGTGARRPARRRPRRAAVDGGGARGGRLGQGRRAPGSTPARRCSARSRCAQRPRASITWHGKQPRLRARGPASRSSPPQGRWRRR